MRYFSRLKPTTLLLAVFFQPFLSEAQRTINSTLALPTELPTGNYDLEVFGNFSTVLAIANPLDERNTLYFAERSGRIIVYSDLENQIREQDPFLIIPSTVTTNGENGLLGLAFHPQYRLNGYFFVFYTSQRENGERTNRISRFSRSQSDPFLANSNSALILFDQVDQASNHNGGDIHFGPDGYLYISLGDEGAEMTPTTIVKWSMVISLPVLHESTSISFQEISNRPITPTYHAMAKERPTTVFPLTTHWFPSGRTKAATQSLIFDLSFMRSVCGILGGCRSTPLQAIFGPVMWAKAHERKLMSS